MTNRRRRQVTAAAELTRLRRPLEHIDLPDAHDPARRHRIDGLILDYHRRSALGKPTSDEYSVTGWVAAVTDRAQDFEHGTIYLDSATGSIGTAGWHADRPINGRGTAPADAGADRDRQQARVEGRGEE